VGLTAGLISQLRKTSIDIEGTNQKQLTSFGKLAFAISLIGFTGSFASELLKSAISPEQEKSQKAAKEEDAIWKARSAALSAEILKETNRLGNRACIRGSRLLKRDKRC
jgi:hypothetical protein